MSFYDHFIEEGLTPKEADKCLSWAFGPLWKTELVSNGPELWNERHQDLMIIKPTDSRTESVKKIVSLYREAMQ